MGTALAAAVLAGCDSLPQSQGAGDDAVPVPPALMAQGAQPQPEQQAGMRATRSPVSFFLAQEQGDQRLTEVKLADGSLWALPDAVLTRDDLNSVEPRRTNEGQAFVRFGFNAQGAAKLAQISQRFAGNLLMVAVGRDVVGLVRIDDHSGGTLDVGMASDGQAIAVADAIADGQQRARSAGQ